MCYLLVHLQDLFLDEGLQRWQQLAVYIGRVELLGHSRNETHSPLLDPHTLK